MKYGDLLLVFMTVVFFLTLAYTLGVNSFYWFLPAGLFLVLMFVAYELKIKK